MFYANGFNYFRIQARKARVGAHISYNSKPTNKMQYLGPNTSSLGIKSNKSNKSGNKYMNEFEQLKAEYSKKREASNVKLRTVRETRGNNYLNYDILTNERNHQGHLRSQSSNSVITRKVMSDSHPIRRSNQPDVVSVSGIDGIRKLRNSS